MTLQNLFHVVNSKEFFKPFVTDIIFIVQTAINCDHFIIVSEGLETLKSIVKILAIGATDAQIKSVFENLKSRLSQNDIEQEVKKSSIDCAGAFISELHSKLDNNQVVLVLEKILIEKLDNESSRGNALKAIQ